MDTRTINDGAGIYILRKYDKSKMTRAIRVVFAYIKMYNYIALANLYIAKCVKL